MKHKIMRVDESSVDCTCGKTFRVSRTKYLRSDEGMVNALLDAFNAHKVTVMNAERT